MAAGIFSAGIASAQTWTLTSAPNTQWSAVASSADGTRLIGVESNASVYLSPDSGTTWISNALSDDCVCAASSALGNTLLTASVDDGLTVYYSTNAGTSWGTVYPQLPVPVGTEYDWTSIVSSADGTKLVVTAAIQQTTFGPFKGSVFTSTNSGRSWIGTNGGNGASGNVFPAANWTSAALSADGSKLVAVSSNGLIFTSTNSGVTCKSNYVPPFNWTAVASSADGQALIAVAANGATLISANGGFVWKSDGIAGASLTSVASSADGKRLVAGSANGNLYTSTNAGITWQLSFTLGTNAWVSVASSADGSKLVAASANGGIYTFQTVSQPLLAISSATNGVTLSWPISGLGFQIQQKSSLAGATWQTLTNAAQTNLTSLRNVITLSPTNSPDQFRLIATTPH